MPPRDCVALNRTFPIQVTFYMQRETRSHETPLHANSCLYKAIWLQRGCKQRCLITTAAAAASAAAAAAVASAITTANNNNNNCTYTYFDKHNDYGRTRQDQMSGVLHQLHYNIGKII